VQAGHSEAINQASVIELAQTPPEQQNQVCSLQGELIGSLTVYVRLRDRLSYANVVGTLALFIALGGTAYGISRINGSQIVNHSIAGSKLKSHTLNGSEIATARITVGNALVASTVRGLLISRGKRWHGRSVVVHSPEARSADTASTPATTLVGLNTGESAVLFSSAPFTLSVSCVGDNLAEMFATSTEDGWYGPPGEVPGLAEDAAEPPFTAGQQVLIGQANSPNGIPDYPLQLGGRTSLAAPSGAALNLPAVWAGLNVFGYACVVNAVGFG
jgi:hypothetical protein